jgi:hypothetical protein
MDEKDFDILAHHADRRVKVRQVNFVGARTKQNILTEFFPYLKQSKTIGDVLKLLYIGESNLSRTEFFKSMDCTIDLLEDSHASKSSPLNLVIEIKPKETIYKVETGLESDGASKWVR